MLRCLIIKGVPSGDSRNIFCTRWRSYFCKITKSYFHWKNYFYKNIIFEWKNDFRRKTNKKLWLSQNDSNRAIHFRSFLTTSGFIIDDAIDYICYIKYNMNPFWYPKWNSRLIKWSASSRWSFGPNSAWSSIEALGRRTPL